MQFPLCHLPSLSAIARDVDFAIKTSNNLSMNIPRQRLVPAIWSSDSRTSALTRNRNPIPEILPVQRRHQTVQSSMDTEEFKSFSLRSTQSKRIPCRRSITTTRLKPSRISSPCSEPQQRDSCRILLISNRSDWTLAITSIAREIFLNYRSQE